MAHRRRSSMPSSEFDGEDEYFDVKETIRAILANTESIIERQDSLMRGLQIINAKENYAMATLDEVLAEMERDTTVSDGIVAMLEKLQADVTAAGGNQAKIDQIFNGFKSNTDKLAAKLVVNTPNEAPIPSGGGATMNE